MSALPGLPKEHQNLPERERVGLIPHLQTVEEAQSVLHALERQPLDAVMVFGIGPVKRPDSEHKLPSDLPDYPQLELEDPVGLDELASRLQHVSHPVERNGNPALYMRLESKLNALAAAELYQRGLTKRIIFSGGRTAKGPDGDEYPSEAALMRDYVIHKFGIPEEDITTEDEATNTIENFALTLNKIDQDPDAFKRLGFLGAHHHVWRIEQLVDRFHLASAGFLSSDPILRTTDDRYARFLSKIHRLETPAFRRSLEAEVRWARGLQELPRYFLPQTAAITNPERLRVVLSDPAVLKVLEEYGISRDQIARLGQMSPDEGAKLRKRIRLIPREIPPEDWGSISSQGEEE